MAVKAVGWPDLCDDILVRGYPVAQPLIIPLMVARVAEVFLAMAFLADLRVFAAYGTVL
jgi:hypothetical protein